MRRTDRFLATLAIAGLAFSIPAPALASAKAQSASSGGGSSSSACRVRVKRSSDSAGVFDVTRGSLSNGDCVCYVRTGPRSQGGSAESALAALLLRRTCADAPLAAVGATGGGISTGLIVGGLLLAGGGLALALSGGSSSP